MAYLSQDQIESWWNTHGGDPQWARVASSVAMAESGGNSAALDDNPATGDYSVGLWQVNYFGSLYDERTSRYGTPDYMRGHLDDQVFAAVEISVNGTDWTPWTSWRDGDYVYYLDGHHPAEGGGAGPTGGGFGGGGGPGFEFGTTPSDQWMEGFWQILSNWVQIFAPQEEAIWYELDAALWQVAAGQLP